MDNCLKMPTYRFRKLVASLFVFTALCWSAWAETYYWVGGENGDWGDLSNWNTASNGSGSHPTSLSNADDAIISASYPKLLGSADAYIPFSKITIESGAKFTINCDVNFSATQIINNGTLIFCHVTSGTPFDIDLGDINHTLGDIEIWGDMVITMNGACSASSLTMASSDSYTVSGTFTTALSGSGNLHITGSATVSNNSSYTGALEVGINVSCDGTITTNNDTNLIIDSGAIVSADAITGTAGSITNDGLIVTESPVSSNLINDDSTGANTTAAAGTFVWTGATDTNWSEPSNWLGGSAPSSSDTIVIPHVTKLPEISGTVTIDYTSKLTIDEDANITISGILNLTGDFSLDSKINNTSAGKITITGNLSADNFAADNLQLECQNISATTKLTCKSITITGNSSISGEIEVDDFIATGLGGNTITLDNATITANSISLSGTSDSSRLLIKGTATTDTFTTGSLSAEYLSIDSIIKLTGASARTTSVQNSVPASGSDATDYAAVVRNGWLIKALKEFEYTWKDAEDSNWDNENNWDIGLVPVSDSKITIDSTTSYFPVLGAGTYKGGSLTIKAGNSITLGSSNLELSGNENITPAANIIFNAGTIDFSGTGTITSTNPITYTGNGTIVFSSSGAQTFAAGTNTYATIEVNKDSGDLEISGNPNITNFTITKATSTTFSGAPTITNCTITEATSTTFAEKPTITTLTDNANAGNISFNKGASITDSVSLSTSGTVTLDGSTNNISFSGSFEHIAGTSIVKGNIGAASFSDVSLIASGSATITTTGAQSYGTINGSGTTDALTLDAGTSTITLNGNVGATKALGSLTLKSPVMLDTVAAHNIKAGVLTFDSTIDGASALTLAGTTSTTLNAKVGDATALTSLEITGPAVINCASIKTSGNQTYSDVVTLSVSSELTTTTAASEITFAKNINGVGKTLTLTPVAGTTIADGVTFEPSISTTKTFTCSGSATFKDSNIFADFTATDLGGKTLTFESGKLQTINGKLTLKGSAENNKLTVTSGGAWNIKCTSGTADDHDLQYIKVLKSNNQSSYYLTAKNSEDGGSNIKWNFPNQLYTWKGGTAGYETNWQTATNWIPASIPGKGSRIVIPVTVSSPKLTNADDIDIVDGSYGTITVNGTFDLADRPIKVYEITNNGLVKANGVSSQQITGIMSEADDSTFEYYDSGAGKVTKLIWDSDTTVAGNQHANLKISIDVELADINVSASGIIAINCSSIKTTNNQTYSGKVSVLDDAELSAGASSTVSFESTVTGNSASSLSVKTAASVFKGAISKLTSLTTEGTANFNAAANISETGTLTTEKANIYCTSITTSGAQTYKEDLSILANASLKSTAGKVIEFQSKVTGNNTSLTIVTADSHFEGIISNLSTLSTEATVTFDTAANISNTGTLTTNIANISCTSIATSGAQTYKGAVSILSAASLSSVAGKVIDFKSTVTGNGTSSLSISTADSLFEGEISNLASLSTDATVTLNAGANISDTGSFTTNKAEIKCSSISTSGAHNYGGAVKLQNNCSLSSSSDNITFDSTINGDPSLTYTLTLSVPNTKTITVDGIVGASGIPSITINQSGNCNFNNNVNINKLTDTAGAGNIFIKNGNIRSFNDSKLITTGTVTFGNNSTPADEITIGIASSYASLTHTAGNTVISGKLTAANLTFARTTLSGTLNAGNITLDDTSGDSMIINNSGLFKTNVGKNLSFTSNFSQTGTGNSVLGGSFTGSGLASFSSDVLLNGNTDADFGSLGFNIDIGNDTNGKKNLIINRNADCIIYADNTKAKNIVIYKGNVILKGNLTVSEDMFIAGSSYSLTDSTTEIEEYFYTRVPGTSCPAGWSKSNYNIASALPDGNGAPESGFSATLSVDSDMTITIGKNFYANGTSLSRATGSGKWNLKIPDLTNPNSGFAETYHSTISNCNVICSDGSTDGAKARLVTLDCSYGGTDTNLNVDFDPFEIVEAYTVRDNAIYVKFNREIRYHAEMINSLDFSGGTFTGFYSDADCTSELTNDIYTKEFYIKAPALDSSLKGAWNTDATGKSSGAGDGKSSDREGIHHNTMPYLDFPRALSGIPFIITDIWGKRLNNYSNRPSASATEPAYGTNVTAGQETYVADKTGPVLWTVRTGQEMHDSYNTAIGETCQNDYDAHNFIEFRYSEPVTFNSDTIPDNAVNIPVTSSFGAVNTSSESDTLTFAGLANLEAPAGNTLQLYTGSNGSDDKLVNAFYRLDDYSIRISIAGWTDGTVTDYTGNAFKKWPGYIEKASQFTGAKAKAVTTPLVQDKATTPNTQEEYDDGYKVEPLVYSDSSSANPSALLPLTRTKPDGTVSNADVYSPWDLSEPVFTPLRFSSGTAWGSDTMSEAIGNTNGTGSTLDRIDFHFFDNTPAYDSTDPAEWFTEIGWCNPNSEASKSNLLNASYTFCADIIGGARQFDTDENRRTTGGIRFSTKAGISPAFHYSTSMNDTNPSTSFLTGIANIHTTIVSQLFTGSSSPMRPANDPDGLYFGLGLTDTDLSVETTFAFTYNENLGYLTDLAGNRLRSKLSKTIDRTPPSFDAIISPVDTKSVYIIFVKELVTDSSKIKFSDNSGIKIEISESFAMLMPKCFRIISIDAGGNAVENSEIQIDTSVPAQIIEANSNESFTCLKLTTTKDIDIEHLKNLYVQLITPSEYPQTGMDPLTNNTGSRVTFIQDLLGNYMSMYSAHSLSDFAVNYVKPLYAYTTDMTENDASLMEGLYEEGSWAVHDWDADQHNYGTLPADHPIAIVADTKGNDKIRSYLSPAPDAASISKQFNADFHTKLRIWLPALQDSVFRALSATNNTNFIWKDGSPMEDNPDNSLFELPSQTVSAWSNGSQISFMFSLMKDDTNPVRIYNNPYFDVSTDKFDLSLSLPVPLFCLRMLDVNDVNSLDLWSFKVRSVSEQRGGVSILNNVIDAGKNEKTVIKVNLAEEGKLNVMVMTLDGNIITYLNRGKTNSGEHYFTWNGRNRNGNIVARGMYFIRVIGSGIDETRKVMVVK